MTRVGSAVYLFIYLCIYY